MQSLAKKVVLVVGGGSGIGLAIGKAFAGEGARVVLSARSVGSLESASLLPDVSPPFSTRVCDAADPKQVNALVAWVEESLGPIAVLVYSAGINLPARMFSDATPDNFEQIMAVNAAGAFHCIKAVLPGMRARKGGTILNIVSIAGLRPLTFSGAPYSASKYAQSALGGFARQEAQTDGVRVTNIYPGETDTPILDKRPVPPDAAKRAQMLKPEDVAAMALAITKLPPHAVVPDITITPSYQIFP